MAWLGFSAPNNRNAGQSNKLATTRVSSNSRPHRVLNEGRINRLAMSTLSLCLHVRNVFGDRQVSHILRNRGNDSGRAAKFCRLLAPSFAQKRPVCQSIRKSSAKTFDLTWIGGYTCGKSSILGMGIMKFGYFDDHNREYVITQPDTPLPWINYLGCQAYFGIISNTAGGYSFYRDARLRRLTRYRYNNAPMDFGGRYVYLRDDESKEFWSPSWQPTRHDLKDYTCRHGMGYTVIGSEYSGIEAHTRYFVPLDENLEIWQLTITNKRAVKASISAFSSIEFCLWDAQDDATNFQRNFNTGQVEVEDGVIYHKTEYRERRNHFAYFACSEPLAGFDTQREAFLGRYRGWDSPAAVEAGQLTNSIAHGWSPIGAHQVKLELAPGETKQIVFLLGYHENPVAEKFDPPGTQTINKKPVKPVIAKYLDPKAADAAFEQLRQYWESLLGVFQVATPDVHAEKFDPPGTQTINKKTVKPVIAKYLDPKAADAAFEQLRQYWESLLEGRVGS